MKILIKDYTSSRSTQAMYLVHGLQNVPNVQAGLWSGDGSLYDAMDQFQPDLLIMHMLAFGNDVVSYLRDDDTPPVKLAMCVTGVTNESIEGVDANLRRDGLSDSIALYFSSRNKNMLPKTKTTMLPLLEAADPVAVGKHSMDYKIDTCVVIDKESEVRNDDYGRSFHFASSNPDLQGKADLCLNQGQLATLLKNYSNVVIKHATSTIPQVFFDAALSGARPVFALDNKDDQTRIGELCKKLFGFSCLRGDDIDHEAVAQIVAEKHTATNRVKTLISQLPINQRFFEL